MREGGAACARQTSRVGSGECEWVRSARCANLRIQRSGGRSHLLDATVHEALFCVAILVDARLPGLASQAERGGVSAFGSRVRTVRAPSTASRHRVVRTTKTSLQAPPFMNLQNPHVSSSSSSPPPLLSLLALAAASSPEAGAATRAGSCSSCCRRDVDVRSVGLMRAVSTDGNGGFRGIVDARRFHSPRASRRRRLPPSQPPLSRRALCGAGGPLPQRIRVFGVWGRGERLGGGPVRGANRDMCWWLAPV